VSASDGQSIELADLERLEQSEAPDLAEAIQAFLEQPDPPLPEEPPSDAIPIAALRSALAAASRQREKGRRQSEAREAWQRYLGQPEALIAPRLRIAELVVRLYGRRNDAACRHALLVLAREAPLVFGLWGGLKRVYKLAEQELDAEVFAALSVRFDTHSHGGDVGRGTLIYLRRRAARFLRLLGKAAPELYPTFAVEVLRAYPAEHPTGSCAVAIMSGQSKKWGAPKGLPKEKKFRPPYLEAWKRGSDPLRLLLETCQSNIVAGFAIRGLRELFPEVLRELPVTWLFRLAARPIAGVHEFLVETLEGSPQLHRGRLKELGLHEAVLGLLLSPSPKARKYAIEYARAHAAELSNERLVGFIDGAEDYSDTAKFVVEILSGRPARAVGPALLGRLLAHDAAHGFASKALSNEFEKQEIGRELLIEWLFAESSEKNEFAREFLEEKFRPAELPVEFWLGVLNDRRIAEDYTELASFAFEQLTKHPTPSVPFDFLVEALGREDIGTEVSKWLEGLESLPAGFDLERVKGLVFDARKRAVAFSVLGNPKLVKPDQIGLGFLLALARRADPALSEWAHTYLLQHMRPEHFADPSGDAEAGIERLFRLATGAKEPEPVRLFAQTYLRCHHPKIGRQQPESSQLGIKPLVPRSAYTRERIWPALADDRADVRRFALALTRLELRRWSAQAEVYELADSNAKEVRNLAYDALREAGQPDADPDFALKLEELDAAQIFSLTESKKRGTRELAMDLIRRHYAQIGGAERLGWLMQSADREVRIFALQLLWEKHRPRGVPSQWKPRSGTLADQGPFEDVEALRNLLRRVLFLLPPPRPPDSGDGARTKRLPSGIAKQRVIELVRDFGLRDAGFARLVAPVLGEFTGSIARGEWQKSLSALLALRARHGFEIEGMV
jgi:hypothetical protein